MTSPVAVRGHRLRQAGSSALFVLALGGCGWFTGPPRPVWIDGGGSGQFPPAQFLVGVGQGSSSTQASEQAYAAVSKIFKAEITAQAKDWESYVAVDTRGRASTEHRLTIDHVTKVATDKVLENVQILDSWFDRKPRQYYALAGMNRAQAETAMVERLTELDRTIQTELTGARQTDDKLTHARNLKRAAKNLVLREAYNTDLRVIRTSGQGYPAAHRVTELTNELEEFLATNLGISVEITGDHAEPVERALIEGLTREGFSVVGHIPDAGSFVNVVSLAVRNEGVVDSTRRLIQHSGQITGKGIFTITIPLFDLVRQHIQTMVDLPRLDDGLRQLPHRGIIQRLDDIDHHMFVSIPFIRQEGIVRKECGGFGPNRPGIQPLDFLRRAFELAVALNIVTGEMKRHAAIHVVQEPVARTVFGLGRG